MYSYTIAKTASEAVFQNVCKLIEAHFKGISKERILEDVDGSTIRIYHTGTATIKVYNDYEVDAVYIDSEIELKDMKLFYPRK